MLLILAIAAVAVHELGHAVCARAHGLEAGLRLRWYTTLVVTVRPETRAQDRSIACAGPLASLLLGLVFLAAGQTDAALFSIGWCGVAQLLPIPRFDGSRIYR